MAHAALSFKGETMQLFIPVASGLEASVKRELFALGYPQAPAQNGRLCLQGDWQDVARLNLFLRGGERVLIELARFSARTFDELYEGVSALCWEEYFTPHTHILIDGKCVKSTLMAIKATGGVVKKAIVERLKHKLGVHSLDEKGERAVVGVSIFDDEASITLDTSGDGLHKRGYRVRTYDAPLRETTAAAMVESSFFRTGKPFVDLFCGSGTIPVEAALIALNRAAGLYRDFDFTAWKCTPKEVLPLAKEEARDKEKRGEKFLLQARDISPKAISIAKFHAQRAGVLEHINFEVGDMRNFTSEEKNGVIISNPPYGERLESERDLFPLYRDFARTFRRLPDWSCYFITSYEGAERAFGGKADKRRKVFNAHLSCGLYAYFGKPPQKP